MIIILIVTFILTMLMGFPIIFVIGVSTLVYCLSTGSLPNTLLPHRYFVGIDSYILMCIPLFMFLGEIMSKSGTTKRLINFANALVGHFRGGLAQVSVVASMFFAGISGSATADVSALGSIIIPSMVDEGYKPAYSAAIIACSSVMGPIIPPSITGVIYGVAASCSIGAVLVSGVFPGILVGLSLMLVTAYQARTNNFPGGGKFSIPNLIKAFKEAFLTLLIPLIIMGGIISGKFTPTEAAGMAVFVALILGFVVYKTLKIGDLPDALYKTALYTSGVMMIVSVSSAFGWVLTYEQIPQKISLLLFSLSNDRNIILLIILIIYIILGTFMESTTIIIIMTPIFLPIVKSLGVDPVHFGAITILAVGIGLVTPPLGLCLFVASMISKAKIEDIVKNSYLLVLSLIVVLFLITYIEPISMFLPNLLFKK